MGMKKTTRQIAAWIACFAILLAALAPSISHAMAAATGTNNSWVEICSIDGIKQIKAGESKVSSLPDSKSSLPTEKDMASAHCPFCQTHASAFVLPPTAAVILPAINGSNSFPALFYQSPSPLFIWAIAQSRAPPSLA
ncbi:MAG: DUF2946 domain-containing protein [Pseudomonadota bacterium]